jgi:hypothetical protein
MHPIIWTVGEADAEFWGTPYQGWCNSATWAFALYFGQERENVEQLRLLPRDDGTVDPEAARRLLIDASRGRNRLRMEPLDDWVEGPVNAREVVEHLLGRDTATTDS